MRLEPDRIFVRDGAVWTSAGITAGIDLALAMIAEDLGEDDRPARRRSSWWSIAAGRAASRSSRPCWSWSARTAGSAPLLGWARERLAEPLGVERLAERAAMSPRNFARAFAAETGVTPAEAVERLRVEAARERIEAGAEPIDAHRRRRRVSATPSACAAPSCAPSASRRRRCGARRGR